MGKICCIGLLFLFFCVPGEAQNRLDLKTFNRHQVDGTWSYHDKKGNDIDIFKDKGLFWEERSNEHSIFTQRRVYYPNGQLKLSGEFFRGNGFDKGITTYYDKQGKIIKTVDNDAPFKNYPWEKVIAYLKRNKADVMDRLTVVKRTHDGTGTYWLISWNTKKVGDKGFEIVKNVQLDANTGKVTFKHDSYNGFE
jgi:hypothetical protein